MTAPATPRAINPTLDAAAAELLRRLAGETDSDPVMWRELWQPPLPDVAFWSSSAALPVDANDGVFVFRPGQAYWLREATQGPLAWLVLASMPGDRTPIVRAETFDVEGRIVRSNARVDTAVQEWAKAIPNPKT